MIIMQPTSDVKMDQKSFDVLKKTIKSIVVPTRERKNDPSYKTSLPTSLGIKLTNRCNLRCKHCYQWNEEGYHHEMDEATQNLDIDVEIVKKLLEDTREMNSRLYLWGGEPLFHKKFAQIAELLENDMRDTTICTNGYLIDKYLEPLIKISSKLELLIAIEGFEKEHDLIRGKGAFKTTIEQINRLVELREQGIYQGIISVHSVINDNMIGKLYELMEFFEETGIDLVLLCFPWFISHDTSNKMDDYFTENFNWLHDINDTKSSWHAFKYQIDPQNIDALMDDLKRINKRVWKTRVRYQPGLDFDEIENFIRGNEMKTRCADQCLVLSTRVDITPTGNVSACKFFAEFSVGNLKDSSLAEIWNSESYDKVRKTINSGLTPACSKCNVLYLHSASSMLQV
jgi:radical SAM protein with 4Fe4S-binding SPASM domain